VKYKTGGVIMSQKTVKMGASKQKSDLKKKIRRVKWIIEKFLEEDLQYEILKNSPELIEKLRIGLKENLKDEERYQVLDGNPSAYIFRYYSILNHFWVQMKEYLSYHRKGYGLSLIKRPFPIGDNFYPIEVEAKIKNDPSKSIFDTLRFSEFYQFTRPTVRVEFETGSVIFKKDRFEIIRNFIGLLEGLPVDIILECSDQKCRRWFIKTHKNKKHCSNKCASRAYQKDLRYNPEKKEKYARVKKKQVERYRKKVLGK